MKKITVSILAAVLLMGQLLSGCKKTADGTKETAALQDTAQETTLAQAEKDTEETESDKKNDQVASADEMAEPVEVLEEGMTAIYGKDVKDGEYSVSVDSSSSMFKITDCVLTVENGQMTAVMTMSGTGYLKLFMGTGEEASGASEEDCITYEENENGEHTFTVPVEALNSGIDCAAFSKKKEKWYDRTLVFRADSLPLEAFADGVLTRAEDLDLEDGNYTAEVELEGGSGKAGVESPASLRVENGQVYAMIVWSSSSYDYMKLGEEKYLPVNTDGNSAFEIPVNVFDWKFTVNANTTAMSSPHEIEYTLRFDSASIQKVQ